MQTDRPIVTLTARLLGFAGLLPQIGAVLLLIVGQRQPSFWAVVTGEAVALVYGAIILSFLGGLWWGFAMRREHGQGLLAAVAIVPSLMAATIFAMTSVEFGWPLVLLGSAILLTLIVDRHLVGTGEAPVGWMLLRVPLSAGLGVLTILAGVLTAR